MTAPAAAPADAAVRRDLARASRSARRAPLRSQDVAAPAVVPAADVVEPVVQTTRSPIAFRTVRRADATRYRGTEVVVQAGRTGVLTRTWAVVAAAGTEVSRTMLREERTKEPVTQVVAVGTKPRPAVREDGNDWHALAVCESGDDPRAVSSSGKFRGLYQFSLRTWRSVGGSGDPVDASRSEQTSRAQRLLARDGRGAWPECGRYL